MNAILNKRLVSLSKDRYNKYAEILYWWFKWINDVHQLAQTFDKMALLTSTYTNLERQILEQDVNVKRSDLIHQYVHIPSILLNLDEMSDPRVQPLVTYFSKIQTRLFVINPWNIKQSRDLVFMSNVNLFDDEKCMPHIHLVNFKCDASQF
jgi:hypothetical protein